MLIVNWGWLLLRSAIGVTVLVTLILSQRFWYRTLWRVTSNWRAVWLRVLARVSYLTLLILIIVSVADGFRMSHRGHLIPNDNLVTIFAGLWFSSALFAYLAMRLVGLIDRLWRYASSSFRQHSSALPPATSAASNRPASKESELLPNPS